MVRQDDFLRDPGTFVREAISCGRVIITDAAGNPVGVLSAPTDRREIIGD
jgi:hypothetical protein